MVSVLFEVLPLALVVAASPINVIPSILVLFSPSPRRAAALFVLGFVVGVTGVLAMVVLVSSAVGFSPSSGHASWVAPVRGILGASLLVAAVRKFRSRSSGDGGHHLPRWMDSVATSSPARALGIGTLLGAANPKNVVVALAAGVSVAAVSLAVPATVGVCAAYVVVATIGVIVPPLAMVILGARSRAVLESWHAWLERHNAAVMAVVFLVFGVLLLLEALAGIR
jgi:threonine/homoserine/homoserine lactone efflux protein